MKIIQIKETCLYVQDLSISKSFYHNKLGFSIISHVENRHIFFRVGSSILLCFIPEVTKNEKNLPPHYAYGPQHIAFEVQAEDYNFWMDKVKAEGIELIHIQKWKNKLNSFYFRDPDGHILEIVPTGIWE